MTRAILKTGASVVALLLFALPIATAQQSNDDENGRQSQQQQSQAQDGENGQQARGGSNQDICQALQSAGDFSTLIKAIEKANLKQTLEGQGPFTLFAPTDEAFNNLPSNKLNALLQNQQQLRSVLLNHVVPEDVSPSKLSQVRSATTAQGSRLSVETSGDQITLNGQARVNKQDAISASNGTIFPIDKVLMPKDGEGQQRMQPGQQQGQQGQQGQQQQRQQSQQRRQTPSN